MVIETTKAGTDWMVIVTLAFWKWPSGVVPSMSPVYVPIGVDRVACTVIVESDDPCIGIVTWFGLKVTETPVEGAVIHCQENATWPAKLETEFTLKLSDPLLPCLAATASDDRV